MLITSLESAGRRRSDSRKSRKDVPVSVPAEMEVRVRFDASEWVSQFYL